MFSIMSNMFEICVSTFTASLGCPRFPSLLWIICVGRYARQILSLQVPANVAARVLDLAEQVIQEGRDGANGYL